MPSGRQDLNLRPLDPQAYNCAVRPLRQSSKPLVRRPWRSTSVRAASRSLSLTLSLGLRLQPCRPPSGLSEDSTSPSRGDFESRAWRPRHDHSPCQTERGLRLLALGLEHRPHRCGADSQVSRLIITVRRKVAAAAPPHTYVITAQHRRPPSDHTTTTPQMHRPRGQRRPLRRLDHQGWPGLRHPQREGPRS